MKLTEAEWQIMKALWKHAPATARQILEMLSPKTNWAYTTVKTMLTRLADKDVVSEEKEGNVSVYQPLISQKDARKYALKGLMDQAFDGAFGPMMHFMLEEKKLSEKQKQQLINILNETEENTGGSK